MSRSFQGRVRIAAVALCVSAATGASAHVALSPGAAAPGATVAAQVIVGHGCSGQPTTAIRLQVPAGVPMVHAMDAEGWTLKIESAKGKVSAATWTVVDGKGKDGPATLPLHIQLPAKAGRVFFPTVQTCGAATVAWTDRAADGAPTPAHPAPSINVGGAPSTAPAEDHSAHGK